MSVGVDCLQGASTVDVAGGVWGLLVCGENVKRKEEREKCEMVRSRYYGGSLYRKLIYLCVCVGM